MRTARRLFGAMIVLAALLAAAFFTRPVSFFRAWSDLHLHLAGAQSKVEIVDGYRIHYYVLGPQGGPAVVLVHGLGGRAQDWQHLAPYLAKAGYRVYLPDLPGYGDSERPVDFSYSISDEALVLVEFIDSIGLKDISLGGWSMGGWIAQRAAGNRPDLVKRLVLFDSAGIYERPKWNIQLFTPTSAEELDQLDAILMPNPPSVPGFIARDVLRDSRQNAWVIHRAVNSMLLGRDTTDSLLPNLRMPVLIVWGAEDHITPLSQGERMQKLIPGSQLNVVAGCGHLAPTQCADKIAPTVLDFLGKQ